MFIENDWASSGDTLHILFSWLAFREINPVHESPSPERQIDYTVTEVSIGQGS